VFYVKSVRRGPSQADFWDSDLPTAHRVGVKFSTNRDQDHPGRAESLAALDYWTSRVLDGATAEVMTTSVARIVDTALRAMQKLAQADSRASDLGGGTRQNEARLETFMGSPNGRTRSCG